MKFQLKSYVFNFLEIKYLSFEFELKDSFKIKLIRSFDKICFISKNIKPEIFGKIHTVNKRASLSKIRNQNFIKNDWVNLSFFNGNENLIVFIIFRPKEFSSKSEWTFFES